MSQGIHREVFTFQGIDEVSYVVDRDDRNVRIYEGLNIMLPVVSRVNNSNPQVDQDRSIGDRIRGAYSSEQIEEIGYAITLSRNTRAEDLWNLALNGKKK